MLSDPEFCPQSRARKTSDRQGSLALRDTELAPSGSQTRSRRRASGPSAPDRSKAAQSSGKKAPAPSAPKKGRELQQSLEPGDRQERLHQGEITRTYLYGPAVCCKPDVSDGGIGLAFLYPARE